MYRCPHIYGRPPITDLYNQIACLPRDPLTQHVINNCHVMTANRITIAALNIRPYGTFSFIAQLFMNTTFEECHFILYKVIRPSHVFFC